MAEKKNESRPASPPPPAPAPPPPIAAGVDVLQDTPWKKYRVAVYEPGVDRPYAEGEAMAPTESIARTLVLDQVGITHIDHNFKGRVEISEMS